MKKKKMLLIATVLLGVMGVISGCKKSSAKKESCQLMGIYNVVDSTQESIGYDSQGRISVLVAGEMFTTFEYSGNISTITQYNAGKGLNKTTAITDADGFTVNIKTESLQTPGYWVNYFNEYDGEQLIRTTTIVSDGRPTQITTYQWLDGNMVGIINGTDTTKLGYDLTRPSQKGDYLAVSELLTGYREYKVKNLFTSLGEDKASYEFGPDGKISAVTFANATDTISNLQYQYKCD